MDELITKYLPDSESANKSERIQALQWQMRQKLEAHDIRLNDSIMKLADFKEKPLKRDVLFESSKRRYRKILHQNKEYLTNVGVAVNTEEGNSMFLTLLQSENIEKLDISAQDAIALFKKLMDKWSNSEVLKNKKNSKKLFELLQSRKVNCEEIVREKDELIVNLRENIEERKKELSRDRNRRDNQMSTLCNRLKCMIDNMEKAGKKEIEILTKMFDKERKEMMNVSFKKLTAEFNQKHEDNREQSYDNLRKSIYNRYRNFQEHKVICYNELQPIRIGVSKELSNLQQHFRETQDELIDNLSKLKYGYHVLDLQIKECRFSRSETLRNKIHYFDCKWDLIKSLKKYSAADEVTRLQNSIRKEQERIATREKGTEREHNASMLSYFRVFNTRQKEIKLLAENIVSADRTIFCHILKSSNYNPPDLSFLDQEIHRTSPEEIRLNRLVDHFLEGIDAQSSKKSTEQILSQSIIITKPLNVELMMNFIYETLNFLVSPEVKEFSKRHFPESMDFVISNSFFPAVGIETVRHLKMFIAHILSRACEDIDYQSHDSVVLHFKSVLDGFEDWRVFYNNKMQSSAASTLANIYDNQQKEFWIKSRNFFSKDKEYVWDEVYEILMTYLSHLKQRLTHKQKTKQLRKEVLELARIMGIEMSPKTMEHYHLETRQFNMDIPSSGTSSDYSVIISEDKNFGYVRKYLEDWIAEHNL